MPTIRFQAKANGVAETVQPLLMSTFRVGLEENRIFTGMPAIALGLRKSFQRTWDEHELQVVVADLVISKRIGAFSGHLSGMFWDASLSKIGASKEEAILLQNTHSKSQQFNLAAGIAYQANEDGEILLDLSWVPRFAPFETDAAKAITLTPLVSWGLRYTITPRTSFEAGVRTPDIANLLESQIFGQLTFSSDVLHRAIN